MSAVDVSAMLRPSGPLTLRQREALRQYALTGSRKEAAARLGISPGYYRELLRQAYQRLALESAIDAFRALGWLRPPS